MPKQKFNLKKRLIRKYFLAQEKEIKKNEVSSTELLEIGMEYIQMRLPVEKITKEFEENLQKRVKANFLRAKIRKATIEDLESVAYIYNRSWMTSNTPFTPITIETLNELIKYPEITILIANVYGTDGGFAILDLDGPNKEYGIIAGLGVLPRFQRKGLGTILAVAAWNYFKEKKVKELRCEVYKENKTSYNFIKSLGFEEFGVKTYKPEDFELD